MVYLCQYGNCPQRLPRAETYVVGWPKKGGAKRYCSPEHAAFGVLRLGTSRGETLVLAAVEIEAARFGRRR